MEGTRQRIPHVWRTRAAGEPRRPGAVTRRTPVQVAGLRYYNPGLGRWTARDPIGEEGAWNLHEMCQNDPAGHWDLLGMMRVCCSPVRGSWYERLFRHCDISDTCAPGEDSYPVWRDTSATRRMDNGVSCACATNADIEACLQRHPYSARPRGPGYHSWLPWPLYLLGNNCQTSVILSLGSCCLRSTWRADWYAGPPRGRCLRGFYYQGVWFCFRWEVPGWQGEDPPGTPGTEEPHWPRSRPPRPPAPQGVR
jgi:RHS repeat-associated protein